MDFMDFLQIGYKEALKYEENRFGKNLGRMNERYTWARTGQSVSCAR